VPLLLALAAVVAPAQTRITLWQLETRSGPDYSATYKDQRVTVRGVVAVPAAHVLDYNLQAIQDGRNGGVLQLPVTGKLAATYSPGDELEAVGTVAVRYGLPVLVPERVSIISHKDPPAPKEIPIRDLQSTMHLGELVRTQGTVLETSWNSGGALIILGGGTEDYKLFVPRAPGEAKPALDNIHKGDTVSVTGVATQYAPMPPYNTGYELLVANVSSIVPMERQAAGVPQPVIALGIAMVLLLAFFLWSRERRLRMQRRRLRRTYKLGEEILGASSAVEVLKRIAEALPGILGVTQVHLYVHNRAAKTLDAIEDGKRPSASISLSSPPGGTPAGAVACFHYRTLLVIPDIDRSPFPIAGQPGERAPKSLLFVPMMAQGEVTGVLELDQDDRVRDFTADEQALAQHLGNQIGVAVRLLDQRTVQEQLFRTEKMAAVGRLISGVVNELQTPLASIVELAHKAVDKVRGGPAERDVAAIKAEAAKASVMVSRLVGFATAEQTEARQVDVSALLRSLVEFREGDWKATGIHVHDNTSQEPLNVLGSQGQLEQVFLSLFVYAEQSLAGTQHKELTIRTSLLARRALIEISFTSSSEQRKPEDTAAVLGVMRSVIAGHGGEVRLIEKNNSDPRFEIELPATVKERAKPGMAANMNTGPSAGYVQRDSSRGLTALVIEPDEATQRQLLALLSGYGYRVVPVTNSDTGLDLAQRMRFDAAFCSLHAPGLNWVELSERMQSRVGGFILLSDGYDTELSSDFEGDKRFVLAKPVQEKDLDRVIEMMQPKPATVIPFKTGTA
jgi:CheY-like chemotaxis protein